MITIVTPVCNEEENVEAFYKAVHAVSARFNDEFEILFIDDGSTDGTFGLIKALASRDSRIRCLRLSRNFGSHAAIFAGLTHARGNAAVIISADLQDPPELIPNLLAKWREGHHAVWATRDSRDDPFLKKFFASAFYWLHRKIAQPTYPRTGMDFGVIDIKIIDELRKIKESNLYLLGMIVWLGFRQAHVPYHRQARLRGVSKWPFSSRMKNALDGIVSFSHVPIRLISYVGITVSIFSFTLSFVILLNRMLFNVGELGWPSLMTAILFIGGVQMIMLGILGEYVWRGVDNNRNRPLYVIMETVGNHGETGEV